MSDSNCTIVIWDYEGFPEQQNGDVVYLWNGYGSPHKFHSIFDCCEKNADGLRNKYGRWIHQFGETVIGNKRLVEHLELEGGLSYWWMTLLAEKSQWKSPRINDAIRLLALEEIVVDLRPQSLKFVSADRELSHVLEQFCLNAGLKYIWERKAATGANPFKLSRALPQVIQGALSLAKYLSVRWTFRSSQKSFACNAEQALFFGSYFFNVDFALVGQGKFHSSYWGGFLSFLRSRGISTNWLHIYYQYAAVSNPQSAVNLANGFNDHSLDNGFHVFLDAYLSFKVIRRVLVRWLKLIFISWRFGKIESSFTPNNSKLCFWPLMAQDWFASTRGTIAISNLLWVELFDKALEVLPKQKGGVYLCENHAWERTLIHSWRKHGHGKLIAVPHSTRSFWDLRFYHDATTIRSSSSPYGLPSPDAFSVNGEAAMKQFLLANYPEESLVKCEALRYQYLSVDIQPEKKVSHQPNVLILGEYTGAGTVHMLKVLEKAVSNADVPKMSYTFKPHPNYSIDPADYPSLNMKIVERPLESIIHDFNVAYTSDATSAAADAYVAGLQVIVMLDGTKLNLSPIRGCPGVAFVSSSEHLAAELRNAKVHIQSDSERRNFFYIDPTLPRWRNLLSQMDYSI